MLHTVFVLFDICSLFPILCLCWNQKSLFSTFISCGYNHKVLSSLNHLSALSFQWTSHPACRKMDCARLSQILGKTTLSIQRRLYTGRLVTAAWCMRSYQNQFGHRCLQAGFPVNMITHLFWIAPCLGLM